MKRILVQKNLFLDEYIPRELYIQYQDRPHILRGLIDDRLPLADQALRDKFGAVTINNWWGLTDAQFEIEIVKTKDRWIRNESGLRIFGTVTGAKLSQHFFGRASDKIFKNATAEEVREYIKKWYRILGITCIEDNVSWVHSDIRNTGSDELLIVNP